jgi:HlyD family secretion protein
MARSAWISAGLLALAAAGAATWWGAREDDPALAYRTASVEQGPIEAAVAAAGTLNPVAQVSVGSQVSGQIQALFADFNTEVKKGQPIARIDPESFRYRVRQAQADVEAARAQVLQAQAGVAAAQAALSRARLDADNAARDLQRRQELLQRQFISEAEFETARNLAGTLAEQFKAVDAQLAVSRAQAVSAQAAVRQREAALAQAQVDLDRTEIRSPVDGVVIKRSVDLGQTVAASLQAPELFIIARNLADMQVEVSIDEADIGRVRAGQPVSFTVDAFPGRGYEGVVAAVRKAALNTQNVITYTVVVSFKQSAAQLLPGMTANVRIVTETRENVVKLPNAALRVRLAGVDEPAGPAPRAARPVPDAPAHAGPAEAGARSSSPAGGVTAGMPSAAGSGARGGTEGRVYVIGRDGQPQAVALRLGIGDGSMTEVLAGGLVPGQQVVTGVQGAGDEPAGRRSRGRRGPF